MRSLYKIIHTSSRTLWGDTERRILREALWMEDQGHQVVIIAPAKSPLLLKAREKGIAVYPLSFQSLAQIGEYGQLKQIFTNEKPYVVNCHGRSDARIALKAAQKTGVVCRIISRHNGGRLKNTWANKKLYKKLSHYVFTTAVDTSRHIKKVFGLTDMEIFSIPDGIVEPEFLIPKDEARKNIASSLGLPPGSRFIGVLGDLPKNKPLKTILQAFNQSAQSASHHLIFSGEAETMGKKDLADLTAGMNLGGRVHFHTYEQGNTWEGYRAYDCGIQPPGEVPYTGVPMKMLEAMYSNCPIIGSNSSGIRDLIIHHKTGLMYSPDSPEELSKMIGLTMNRKDATRERSNAARNGLEKHHTMDAMGRDIIRIYRLHQVRLERRFHPN